MAWTYVAHRGNAAPAKDAGTATVSVSPSAALVVGSVIIARCVSDNIGTTDSGASSEHTVTDNVTPTNTWTKIREQRRSPTAVAGDGVVASVWVCKVTTQIG